MRVLRHPAAFTHLLKVFRRELSSRPSTLPLMPVQEGDMEFGTIDPYSLVPTIHSDLGSIADSREECRAKEKPFANQLNGVQQILANCLIEASVTQFPASMMSVRLDLRQGYVLVAPPGTCVVPDINYKDDVLDDFWVNLERIMCGDKVFTSMPALKPHSGQVVGHITDEVLKQLVIFDHHTLVHYGKWVEMTEEQLHIQHLSDQHTDFLANKLIIERMRMQRQIVTGIVSYGVQFQGFNAQLASEFTLNNSGYLLRINPDWNIVVEHS